MIRRRSFCASGKSSSIRKGWRALGCPGTLNAAAAALPSVRSNMEERCTMPAVPIR